MKTFVARCAIAAVVLVSSSPGWSQAMLPELKKQPNAQAVLDEHLDALSHCDWNRIVAQYPDDAQINLPGGTIVKGRQAIGDLFAEFCKDPKPASARIWRRGPLSSSWSPRLPRQAIAAKLKPDYMVNPNVSAEIVTRRPFYVIGEVQKPGNYPYVSDMTAVNAIAMAGGFTRRARKNDFYIRRLDKDGKVVRIEANVGTVLQPGDTLEVRERVF